MASTTAATKTLNSTNVLFSALYAACMAAMLVSSFQFEVGGEKGWIKPTGNEPETYNEWAAKNRFHIGDTVFFKYQGDSVLVVSPADYLQCNTSNPVSKFDDGSTVYRFDHPGFFYFISGQPGHCKSGQRIIIRVMHPSEVEAPEIAPSHAAGGGSDGDWGPSGVVSSAAKLSVVSLFLTASAGIFMVLYMFM